ncbi:hypothetical protein FRC17_011033 [Serendipita sp. 399]|nr:hypothetical protein FRC17_011033 [Serendipita sp. 399]
MFFDLNIPVPAPGTLKFVSNMSKKKGKQKTGVTEQPETSQVPNVELFPSAQVEAIERRIDVLVHLGYTVLALNQIIQTCFSPNGHINYLNELVRKLKRRDGIIILKRLTIILDEGSEKGTGLTKQHQAALMQYDILSLQPTTQATFSLACLKYSMPSTLTAHIISLPLTGPRLPFFFKHTLVRTAIKNGAVLEISYSPAVGGAGEVERRNCIIMLGFPPDEAKKAISDTAKSITIKAYTRKTHQAILSEPKLIFPQVSSNDMHSGNSSSAKRSREDDEEMPSAKKIKP